MLRHRQRLHRAWHSSLLRLASFPRLYAPGSRRLGGASWASRPLPRRGRAREWALTAPPGRAFEPGSPGRNRVGTTQTAARQGFPGQSHRSHLFSSPASCAGSDASPLVQDLALRSYFLVKNSDSVVGTVGDLSSPLCSRTFARTHGRSHRGPTVPTARPRRRRSPRGG